MMPEIQNTLDPIQTMHYSIYSGEVWLEHWEKWRLLS